MYNDVPCVSSIPTELYWNHITIEYGNTVILREQYATHLGDALHYPTCMILDLFPNVKDDLVLIESTSSIDEEGHKVCTFKWGFTDPDTNRSYTCTYRAIAFIPTYYDEDGSKECSIV